MRDLIKKILEDIRPDVDFENDNNLIDNGILDSFDIITLAGELCENFNIEIGAEDIIPENFNSLDLIVSMVQCLQNN